MKVCQPTESELQAVAGQAKHDASSRGPGESV